MRARGGPRGQPAEPSLLDPTVVLSLLTHSIRTGIFYRATPHIALFFFLGTMSVNCTFVEADGWIKASEVGVMSEASVVDLRNKTT